MPRDTAQPRPQWGRSPGHTTCSDCGQAIAAGEPCTIHALVTDDTIEHIATCHECTTLRGLFEASDHCHTPREAIA